MATSALCHMTGTVRNHQIIHLITYNHLLFWFPADKSPGFSPPPRGAAQWAGLCKYLPMLQTHPNWSVRPFHPTNGICYERRWLWFGFLAQCCTTNTHSRRQVCTFEADGDALAERLSDQVPGGWRGLLTWQPLSISWKKRKKKKNSDRDTFTYFNCMVTPAIQSVCAQLLLTTMYNLAAH